MRYIACLGAISGLIGGIGAVLPMSALAQTATVVNVQIKQLQNEIRAIQKQHQAQIRGLQEQLDDLNAGQAAQAAPKAPEAPSAPAAPTPLAILPTAAALPPPVQGGPGAPPPPAKGKGFLGTGVEVSLANTYLEGGQHLPRTQRGCRSPLELEHRHPDAEQPQLSSLGVP